MITAFYIVFIFLIFAELIKGLSANGTPPILQKLSWQIDLAYFMWTSIVFIRILSVAVLAYLAWSLSSTMELLFLAIPTVLFSLFWAFIYWLFNLHWVGKKKFEPLVNPTYKKGPENKVEESALVMGVNWNGVQKAYPISIIFYHHQVPDTIADQTVWVTYCGLCNSGRVFERTVDGRALDFTLVGAVTFNAVFRDSQTKSWWRQETGEAAKGKLKGTILKDLPMEQMSLDHWLAKHPDSEVLQYDPNYQKKYDVRTKLMHYEASLPGWHMQETPSLVIGVELDGVSKGYDWTELTKIRMVMDSIKDNHLLLLSSEDGMSPFVYDRTVDGKELKFEMNENELKDVNTGSTWNLYGKCTAGKMEGKEMAVVQMYQQYVRAWISFHPNTEFYNY